MSTEGQEARTEQLMKACLLEPEKEKITSAAKDLEEKESELKAETEIKQTEKDKVTEVAKDNEKEGAKDKGTEVAKDKGAEVAKDKGTEVAKDNETREKGEKEKNVKRLVINDLPGDTVEELLR
jgi:hypothetical protein